MPTLFFIGDTLPNGAKILNMGRISRDGHRIVLASWDKGGGPECVSWLMAPDGTCEFGSYSHDYAKAFKRYVERLDPYA